VVGSLQNKCTPSLGLVVRRARGASSGILYAGRGAAGGSGRVPVPAVRPRSGGIRRDDARCKHRGRAVSCRAALLVIGCRAWVVAWLSGTAGLRARYDLKIKLSSEWPVVCSSVHGDRDAPFSCDRVTCVRVPEHEDRFWAGDTGVWVVVGPAFLIPVLNRFPDR
jgi:hypothetical protein